MNNTVNDTQVSSIQRKYKETTHKEYEFMKKGNLGGVKSIYINLCVIMLNYECFNMNDVIVYSFLRECCRFTGHEKASTLVSNEKLSQLSGLSISTVKRSLENLKQYEIIKVEGRGAHNRALSLQVDFLDTDFSKYLQDELKAKKMAENKSYACIDDKTVYGWAVHYFEEDEIQGKLFNLDGTEFEPPKPIKKETPKVEVKEKPKQPSLFDFITEPEKEDRQNEELENEVEEEIPPMKEIAGRNVDTSTGEVISNNNETFDKYILKTIAVAFDGKVKLQ